MLICMLKGFVRIIHELSEIPCLFLEKREDSGNFLPV